MTARGIRIHADTPRARALAQRLAQDGMPADAREIFRARNVVAITADGRLCIKSFKRPGLLKGFIYGYVRMPKARRAWLNAARLRSLGIPTPAPVAAVECRSWGLLGNSYYVCEALHGWREMRQAENLPYFNELVGSMARFILDMHRQGVLMKDLTPGNVLFRRSASGYDFVLVDINRMEFDVADRRRLLATLGVALDTEDGVAALARAYASISGDDPQALEATARHTFRARWQHILRKKRLKKLLRISKS